jgi:hypothetical protein
MPFPSVRSQISNVVTSNSNAWTITYPATISSGDLLLLNVGSDGNPTITAVAAGFSVLFSAPGTGNACRGATLVKVATGSETGTFTLNLTASEQGVWRVQSFQGWHGIISGGVEASTGTTGDSTAPNPDSLTPSWGSDQNRWIACYAADDGRTDATSYPTDYDLNQVNDSSGGASGAGFGAAGRDFEGTTQDPGVFAVDLSQEWIAWTIAIRGSAQPPAVTGTGGVSFSTSSISSEAKEIFSGSGGISLSPSSISSEAKEIFSGSGGILLKVPTIVGVGNLPSLGRNTLVSDRAASSGRVAITSRSILASDRTVV